MVYLVDWGLLAEKQKYKALKNIENVLNCEVNLLGGELNDKSNYKQ